jgi:hypothetical protein
MVEIREMSEGIEQIERQLLEQEASKAANVRTSEHLSDTAFDPSPRTDPSSRMAVARAHLCSVCLTTLHTYVSCRESLLCEFPDQNKYMTMVGDREHHKIGSGPLPHMSG